MDIYETLLGADFTLLDENESVSFLYYPPKGERKNGILITRGLSDFEMSVPEKIKSSKKCELFFCFPHYWPDDFHRSENENYNWPLKWIKKIAAVPQSKNTWLGPGHSFPAEKIAPISAQEAFILSMPKLYQDFNALPDSEITFFAIIPIEKVELNYKLKNGAPKFLEKFLSRYNEVIDTQREPVIKRLWKIF